MIVTGALFVVVSAGLVLLIFLSRSDARLRDRTWEKERQNWALERQQLLDRIMFLSDRPWGLPEQHVPDEQSDEPDQYDPMGDPFPSYEGLEFSESGRV